jgi:Uma2 family endonuclease
MTLAIDRTQSKKSLPIIKKQAMTWAEYEQWREDRDAVSDKQLQWFFDRDCLWVRDMGWEGFVHAQVKDLFIMLLLTFWLSHDPQQKIYSMSGGLLEKTGLQAAAPDIILYLGDGHPVWQEGETRRIDLDRWSVPNLVGEVADTTLESDLHEMKQIYAALGIPEYWVVDVQGRRVLMFQLAGKHYVQVAVSGVMSGLTVEVLGGTIDRCLNEGHGAAVAWFLGQIGNPE